MHPLREARLHYVEPGLAALQASSGGLPQRLRVLDVGFGRGMNTAALLSACAELAGSSGESLQEVEVLGFEPHPEALEPWPHRPPRGALFPWWGASIGRWHSPGATVEVRPSTVQRGLSPDDGRFDLVLLDLYSPSGHPEHWADALFERLAAAGRAETVLSSYSCARVVRDGLAAAGWEARVLRRDGIRDTLVASLQTDEQR
jgi:hypothetical protein